MQPYLSVLLQDAGPTWELYDTGADVQKTFCKLPTSGDHLLSRRPQGWPCDGAKGQVLNHTGTFPIKVFIGSKAVTNKFGIIHDIQEEAILRLELVCQNDINYYPVQHNLTWVVLALWNFGTAQALWKTQLDALLIAFVQFNLVA